MTPLYDFLCDAHGVFESLEPSETAFAHCPKCQRECPRHGVPTHSGYLINNWGTGSAVKKDAGSFKRTKKEKS